MWDEDEHVVKGPLPLMLRWLVVGVDYGTTDPFAAELIGIAADPVTKFKRLYVSSEWRYDGRRARKQMTDAEYSVAVRGWLDKVPIPGTEPPILGVAPEYIARGPVRGAASFNSSGATGSPRRRPATRCWTGSARWRPCSPWIGCECTKAAHRS